MSILPPQDFEEWLGNHFWWNQDSPSIGPAFSHHHATTLYHAGIQRIRNVWLESFRRFLTSQETTSRFCFRQFEFQAKLAITSRLTGTGGRLLQWSRLNAQDSDWFGLYDPPDAPSLPAISSVATFLGSQSSPTSLWWHKLRNFSWSSPCSKRYTASKHYIAISRYCESRGFPERSGLSPPRGANSGTQFFSFTTLFVLCLLIPPDSIGKRGPLLWTIQRKGGVLFAAATMLPLIFLPPSGIWSSPATTSSTRLRSGTR
jgi:hypothetical protein